MNRSVETYRDARKAPLILHCLFLCAVCCLPTSGFAQDADAYARAAIRTVVRDTGQLPADATVVDYLHQLPPSPLNAVEDIEPGTAIAGKGVWVYADDTGRVRTGVETGTDRTIAEGDARLWWSQLFQKSSDTESPSYVVNPTELRYFLGAEAVFEFLVGVKCYEDEDALRSGKFHVRKNAFFQYARISNGVSYAYGEVDGVEVLPDGPLLVDQEIPVPNGNVLPTTLVRTTFGFKGNVDVSACAIGDLYRIVYILRATATDQGEESSAYAFVGDPLEPDTGFVFDHSSPPLESTSDSGQYCNSNIPATRYADNGDGTTTDTMTGLIWQRCALDYEFDDSGTPDIPGDDYCRAVDTGRVWITALKDARDGNDVAPSEDDWRLPNIKELESIVDLSCGAPAIVSAAFPDTPAASFWSATPDSLDGMAAKVVDTHLGTVQSLPKSDTAFTRLVRNSGTDPVAPLVSVKLGNAQTTAEGNSVDSNQLVFPVRLSRIETSDVSVSYSSGDASAIAGGDYVKTTGTLVIPAGETTGEISVPLIGDELAEPGELVEMNLLSSSVNARIVANQAVGAISDDEPRITIHSPAAYEGDSGQSVLSFLVFLDKPATTEIDFEFSAGDDTATVVDGDFVPLSGLVTIPAGIVRASFDVPINGDQIVEGTERIRVQLVEPDAGNAHLDSSLVYGYIVDDESGAMTALNDTGVDTCADQFTAFAPCPQPDYPGQDAEVGRDVAFNDDSDGYAGMVLTKVDAGGNALVDQSAEYSVTPWECVVDEITGLTWEVKTTDGALRHNDWTYSWYVSSGIDDGGDAGTSNGGTCGGGINCDTEAYAAAVNAAGMCGLSSGWRMPSREELLSLDTNLAGAVAVDEAYFPNARVAPYNWWTSTSAISWSFAEHRLLQNEAWYLTMFSAARVQKTPKSGQLRIRLVRNN